MFHYALLYTKSVPNYTGKSNILRLSGKNLILGGVLVKKDRGNWWVPPVKEKAY